MVGVTKGKGFKGNYFLAMNFFYDENPMISIYSNKKCDNTLGWLINNKTIIECNLYVEQLL